MQPLLILRILLSLLLCTASGLSSAASTTDLRIFDTRRQVVSDAQAVFDAAARADVVFVGEQHDDRAAHRFQLDLLQALGERGRPVVLAMEMFDRDVQPSLDAYLAGRIGEPEMLGRARPWPNYRRDYRPLVEFARARGWPVAAANAPRPLAAGIARRGLAALETLSAADRRHLAAELQCGRGAYREKFMAEMRDMTGHDRTGGPPPDLGRMFEAQCVRDEAMAETVAARLAPGRTVVHLNGAFHSDEGLGAVERLRRRRPETRILVLSVAKGASPPSARSALGDFVIWTP